MLLVLQNKFQEPLTGLDISALELLASLFSTGEKFPTSHYGMFSFIHSCPPLILFYSQNDQS